MIAILSSISAESDLILSALSHVQCTEHAGKEYYKGNYHGHDVLLAHTGIGKVNAAHTSTMVIEKYSVQSIVNVGIGGAYEGSGLNPGDVAVATKEVFGDDGVITSSGWKDMKEIGIPVVKQGRKKLFNEYVLPRLPRSLFQQKGNIKVTPGVFVTLGSATGTPSRAKELKEKFGGICENMEGAAIAQVCALYNIPIYEIRGISNMAGVRNKRKWKLKEASENSQQIVMRFLESL